MSKNLEKRTLLEIFVHFMKRLQDRLTQSLAEQPPDWRSIEETRARLVQMRFRNNDTLGRPHSNYMTDMERSNTTIGGTSLGTRMTQREAMRRWFVAGANGLEAQLKETIYKDQSSERNFRDDDWNLNQRRKKDAYTNEAYEPLLIPGVNYDLNPESQPFGYIEQTDFPALEEEPQSEVFGYIEMTPAPPAPFGIGQTYQDTASAFGGGDNAASDRA
ncbi:MAG: hypothetical protein ACRD3W_30200 [Terriglobales bacterium]